MSATLIHMEAVELLKNTLAEMRMAADAVEQAIMEDKAFNAVLPDQTDADDLSVRFDMDSREAAAKSLVQLTFPDDDQDDPHIDVGVITVTGHTIDLIEHFNVTKQAFQDAVVKIRKEVLAKGAGRSLASAFEFEVESRIRDMRKIEKDESVQAVIEEEWQTLNRYFRSLDFGSINFTRAYTKTQVFRTPLEFISWSWSKQHKSINNLPDQATQIAFAEKYLEGEALSVALDLISKLDDKEELAIVKPKPPKLTANLTFLKPDEQNKLRKPIKVSGVIVIMPPMPDTLYRSLSDSSGARKPRKDTIIEDTPYIKALGAYRYKQGTRTK